MGVWLEVQLLGLMATFSSRVKSKGHDLFFFNHITVWEICVSLDRSNFHNVIYMTKIDGSYRFFIMNIIGIQDWIIVRVESNYMHTDNISRMKTPTDMQADGHSVWVLQWHCCSTRPVCSSLLAHVHLGKITGEFTYVSISTHTHRETRTPAPDWGPCVKCSSKHKRGKDFIIRSP